jgi:hypothetical protein
MNLGKATKAESRGGVTSQPLRGASSTEQKSGEAQSLTVGAGDKPMFQRSCYHQANVGRVTKVESRGGMTSQNSKIRQVVDPRADVVGQRAEFKTELHHLAGVGAYQIVVAEE